MVGEKSIWPTPFMKQCYVSAGVYLNVMSYGALSIYLYFLLPLRANAEDPFAYWGGINLGSCIAGTLINVGILSRCGRRLANLISVVFLITGWLIIVYTINAPNSYLILVARISHGICVVMIHSSGTISIGEYTSAKNRGVFLATIYIFVAVGMLAPSLVNFITLQQISIICSAITFIDLLIVYNSPETPSFLADKGRSRECRAVFRWLRGNEDNEELEKMKILTQKMVGTCRQSSNIGIRRIVKNVHIIVRKGDFWKPIILMITIYIMNQQADDDSLVEHVIHFVGYRLKMILAILNIISIVFFIFIVKTVNRRTILFTAGCLNTAVLLMKSLYVYVRFDFDQPFVATFFFYVHMFIKSIGIFPMTFTLAGEVFPLRYRSLASGISTLFLYPNISQLLHDAVGGWGAYALHAGVVALCLGVAALLLPETKDRTLQDIEDEFRDRSHSSKELLLSSPSVLISVMKSRL